MAEKHEYAERMFPAPVDLGIAQADRAVCNVKYGTSSYLEGDGRRRATWYEGGGGPNEKAVAGDRRSTRRRGGLQTQGDPFEPVKIGDPRRHGPRPAARRLDRPDDPRDRGRAQRRACGVAARSRSITADARGLPRENYRKVIDGYKWLVEQGCVVILGPMISDNCLDAAGRSPTRSACR